MNFLWDAWKTVRGYKDIKEDRLVLVYAASL